MTQLITIPGFSKFSKQKIFDTVVDHISQTRVASTKISPLTDKPMCSYSGSGCNAAPFIREDKRAEADEVGEWYVLVSEGLAPIKNQGFMARLQSVHDDAAMDDHEDGDNLSFMQLWHAEMVNVALEHNLDATKLLAVTV